MSTQQTIAGLGHSNTNKRFKFILSTKDDDPLTLTHAPDGWKDSELTFVRDKKYKGVLENYSTNELRFVKKGRDFIQTAYERGGIDYNITITIYLLNNSTFKYQSYFTGRLDLSTYKIDAIAVTCEVINTGFQQTILNRDDIKVDLLSTKYIGGGDGSMAAISGAYTQFYLPAYTAQANADWVLNSTISPVTAGSGTLHHSPMAINATEFDSESYNQAGGVFAGLPTEKFFQSGGSHTIDLTATITVNCISQSVPDVHTMTLRLYKGAVVLNTFSPDTTVNSGTTTQFTYSISQSGISLVSSDILRFVGVTSGAVSYSIQYVTSSLAISEDLGTSLSAINVESYQIYEATLRCIQMTSGESNPMYSDLLGRTDSKPNPVYGSDGDFSLVHLTKGKLIRSFPIVQDGTTIQTFNVSLSDIFDTINSIKNIGLGFEVISSVNKVRIEKESYFFDIEDNPDYPATDTEVYITNQILDLSGDVTDAIISKEVLPDWYANEVDVGYNTFEYENVQGLKEFNTKSTYAIPIKAVKSKLDLVAPYRADTQGINKLREKPYSSDPTEDVSGDEDIFIFDVKRASDWTAKTNEDFDLVSGGVDPSQSYNLSFSPRRNLENHGNRFRSMQLAIGDELQWLKSDKNTKLITQKTGESTTKAENGDLTVNNLTKGYWIPEAYNVEAPVDESTISAIQANPYGVIKLSSTKYGWILEVQTNNETGKGQFKLLRVDLNNVKVV